MIQVKGLIKNYGNFRAVDNVSFDVKPGEVFGFLGRMALGKTTTMRMIAGLLLLSEGQITIDGFDLRTHPQEAKRISSFIPDRPYLHEKSLRNFWFSSGAFTKWNDSKCKTALRKC